MKLRSPWLINILGTLGAGLIRTWMSTVCARSDSLGQHTDPWDPTVDERYIYVIWHENLIALARFDSAAPMAFLISRSSDGEFVARISNLCGVRTIRGSSSNGGTDAMEEMLHLGKTSHILITADGPRGPRQEIKRGLVYLAAWTGMAVVPLGMSFGSYWRAKSWDQTVIPRPFTRLRVVGAPAIRVPQGLGKAAMENYRQLIEQRMHTANQLAEDWVQERISAPRWPTEVAPAKAA